VVQIVSALFRTNTAIAELTIGSLAWTHCYSNPLLHY